MLAWLIARIDRWLYQRSINKISRRLDMSPAYVKEIIDNFEAYEASKLSYEEWRRNVFHISLRYPVDSGLRELLKKQEGIVQ